MVLGIILEVILFLIAVAIYIFIIFQGGKAQGLGGTLTGKSDANLFQNVKPNYTEKITFRLTMGLISLFIVLGFIMCVLVKHGVITI